MRSQNIQKDINLIGDELIEKFIMKDNKASKYVSSFFSDKNILSHSKNKSDQFTDYQRKILIEDFKFIEIPVVEKRLACGDVGLGAIANTDTIYDIIKKYASVLYYIFSNHNDGLLRTINDYFLNNYHSSYIDYKTKYDSYDSYESYSNTKNTNIKYFSCVRHPQSRLVSLYTFLKPSINFDTFVIQLLSKNNNDINKEKEVPSLKKIIHKQISYEKQKESLSKINCEIKKCLNKCFPFCFKNANVS